ncbi:MAG: rod shape-determining protein MreC [Sphingomonadaceae bacterium]
MAPPSNRRSGFSRRAQYTTFFGYAVGVLGAFVGGVLLLVSIVSPDFFSGLRSGGAAITEPVGGATARTRAAGNSVFETIEGYATSGQRVAKLKRELAEARRRLAKSNAISEENRRLRALLKLSTEDTEPVAVTRITASSASSSRRFATIGAGASDGIVRGMPVRSDLGLIGRVLEVGRGTAQVLLITDTASQVPVRRDKDSVAAFAQGRGDGTLQIRLIRLGINPLKVGDTFVTSGSGGLFHPGTPTAVVAELTRDGAIARVLADPANSSFVIVESISTLQLAEQETASDEEDGNTQPPQGE